ncbi:Clp protease/crotonase-like domain-containing protein [Cupriavidus sp. 8B]
MKHIEVVADRGVMFIGLNRPDRKNAITFDKHGALAESIRGAGRRGEVRAVVIHDSEEAFTSGNDDASEATSRLVIFPEFGSSQLPPNNVGTPRATELLLLGEPCTPQDEAECGLINILAGTALEHAMDPCAIRAMRSLIRRSEDEGKLDPIDLKLPESAICLRSAEPKNALAAFLERRAPGFSLFS